MAKHLNTNIDPSQITIQNIDDYNQQTFDTIEEIRDEDITKMENDLKEVENNLSDLRDTQSTKMRFFQQNQPTLSEYRQGMGWFILTN